MKRLILCLTFILNFIHAFTQEPNNEIEYIHYSDSVTANLDISKIPYDILYDKVEPLSNLDYFVMGNDSSRSSAIHFFQAVHEFYYAHFDTSGQVSSSFLLNQLQTWEDNHAVNEHPLALLFTSFGELKPESIENGWIGNDNGIFYDIPYQNPYREVHSSVISILHTDDLYLGTHKIFLDQAFLLGNDYRDISQIKINFHDTRGWQVRNLSNLSPNNWNSIAPLELTT